MVAVVRSLALILLLSACGGATVQDAAPDSAVTDSATTDNPATENLEPKPAPESDLAAAKAKAKAQAARPDTPPDAAPDTDRVVIPGERVGPITATTSRQDLDDLFGPEAVEDGPVYVGEGYSEPGTIVTLDADTHLSVVWLDEEKTQPLYVSEISPGWATTEGLEVGSSFDDLRKTLGPFQFYGFAWDYEGSVVLENTQLDAYYGDLLLSMRPSQASVEANPTAYEQVIGDQLVSSEDPNLTPLDIAVYKMTVYLNDLPVE